MSDRNGDGRAECHRFAFPLAAFLAAFIACLPPGQVFAQDDPARGTVSVGLYESPPFVMNTDGGAPEGMSIELWELLAERLDLSTDYSVYPTVRALAEAVGNGKIGVAVSNLTIT